MSDTHLSTTVTYLEMLNAAEHSPKPLPTGVSLTRIVPPAREINRRMYEDVGRPWAWRDKLSWTDAAWRAYADRDELQTWVASLNGVEIGYFELEVQPEGNVQIQYFGLLPEFTNQGLGGPLLSAAVERSWAVHGARRVWVHTCTLDHPAALPNYLRRGFKVFDTMTH
jgi:GNAT superfamily N-acetyltransferase